MLDSCDVADALLKLKHPHGGFLSGLYVFIFKRFANHRDVISLED